MKAIIEPGALHGNIAAIPSKSHVHRLLICAALGDSELLVPCRNMSQDILATLRCLNALGGKIKIAAGGVAIGPISRSETKEAFLDCKESGSTYRFLAPVVCALSRKACFRLSGKLPERPMEGLWSALEAHGAQISGKGADSPRVSGPLTPGRYEIPGDISSQFISGLLFALPLLPGDSRIVITKETQSLGYIRMTLDVLKAFSVNALPAPGGFLVPGRQAYVSPHRLLPEGDWSNSAFWLCSAAAGRQAISVTGLPFDTCQGDSKICAILRRFGAQVECNGAAVTVSPGVLRGIRLDAGNIPDLVPAVAIAASAARGTTVIENAGRLRLKESDRIRAVCDTLNALGGSAEASGDTIAIRGRGGLTGGAVDSCGDHRIAMMAAAASVICRNSVVITGAEAVEKSYPGFFDDFAALGGNVMKGEEEK